MTGKRGVANGIVFLIFAKEDDNVDGTVKETILSPLLTSKVFGFSKTNLDSN
jgi:hypothetical protein